MAMYGSRLTEENQSQGELNPRNAAVIYHTAIKNISTDYMIEMTYPEKKRMHNLKYFTWVEQQGKSVEELNAQWYDDDYWKSLYAKADEWDEKITEFNQRTGVINEYEG
jgi:hypothetical protein